MPTRGQFYAEYASHHLDSKLCPACGQELPTLEKHGLSIHPASIVFRGQEIPLTYFQLLLVELLFRSYPQVVSKDRIYTVIYGDYADPPEAKTLDVHLLHLRRRLKHSGIVIKSSWGRGWSLVLPELPSSTMSVMSDNEDKTILQTKELA